MLEAKERSGLIDTSMLTLEAEQEREGTQEQHNKTSLAVPNKPLAPPKTLGSPINYMVIYYGIVLVS